METTGEAIGQNMLAPDYSPHPPQTSRGVKGPQELVTPV